MVHFSQFGPSAVTKAGSETFLAGPAVVMLERRYVVTDAQRAGYVARDIILKLLSNDEVARVSAAEAAFSLANGDEYFDLEHLDQGALRAKAATKVTMGHVVPCSAVSNDTWSKILAQFVA